MNSNNLNLNNQKEFQLFKEDFILELKKIEKESKIKKIILGTSTLFFVIGTNYFINNNKNILSLEDISKTISMNLNLKIKGLKTIFNHKDKNNIDF